MSAHFCIANPCPLCSRTPVGSVTFGPGYEGYQPVNIPMNVPLSSLPLTTCCCGMNPSCGKCQCCDRRKRQEEARVHAEKLIALQADVQRRRNCADGKHERFDNELKVLNAPRDFYFCKHCRCLYVERES